MLFISPPFGNYLNLPKTTPIKGSFTLEPRPGLLGQIYKTLYYSKEQGGWVNKIGLRNKGIDFAIDKYKNSWFPFYRNSVISIAILHENEIDKFIEKIPPEMPLEINVSCPNVNHALVSQKLNGFLNPERKWCSIKLGPKTTSKEIRNYYNEGFRTFHCSNTLPVKDGGLSGPPLIPYTWNLTKHIKETYPDTTVISGGGIQTLETVDLYKNTGADHVSISSVCFHPWKFVSFYSLYCFHH